MCFCFFTGSKSDVRHRGLPFKPLKPLKSLKTLETCQKGLARGCSTMFFYRIRKRRETSGPARQTPQTPQIPHQNAASKCVFFTGSKSDVRHRGLPFKPLKPLETCQKGLARGCFKMFFTGSKSDVRHRGLPFKPLKSLKPLETCQKGLARGCSKMFF